MSGGSRQGLQSTLLRLCVLCATSLQAVHPSQAPQEIVDNDAAQQDGSKLAEQIHHDILALFQKVTKETTGLSLAMRPPKGTVQDTDEPLAGLDDHSVNAASALLQSLATDIVPKLVFLANLAQKNQAVWTLTEAAANDESVKEAQKMGAQVVYGEGAKGEKAVSASVGRFFAAEIARAVSDVVELVAQLCQSFMDLRTRAVLERAQARREGAAPKKSVAPAPSRAASLSLTKRLWSLCDGLAGQGEASPHIARLPRSNKEAVAKVWKQSQLMMEDGIEEMQETITGEEPEEEDDDELGAQWSKSVKLSDDERRMAQSVLTLLQRGMSLQKDVLKALYKGSESTLDYDEVGVAISELSEAQDNLVAATLYGEGAAEDELGDDAPEEEDDATEEDQEALEGTVDGVHEAANEYLSVCRQLAGFPRESIPLASTEEAHRAVLTSFL